MIGAVDIGGTKFAVGMLSRAGEVLARQEVPSAAEEGPHASLGRIITMLRETARQAGGELEGIGIGCTGPVYPLTGEVGRIEFLPGWEGLNLAAEIEKPFGLKVALENDADASALGEYAWGAGQGSTRFLYVTVSTGIGVGFVIDGQLYRGVEGAHPEIGHHVIDPSGPQCFCGAHGCWESLAGGLALARFANRPSARAACEAAEGGDPQATQAVAGEARYLGLGIANLVSLYTPEIIALGGGVMQSRHLFWEKIEQTVRENCGLVPFELTRLVPARLGRDVGLAGATQAWIGRFG
jgi:glucokinase